MQDYEYLIHLIYCTLSGTVPTEKPAEVSFACVYRLGAEHEVANVAFPAVDRLKQKPEEALYNEWKLCYYFSLQRDAKQQMQRDAAVQLMHENGIRTLEAQGTVTKTLYPSPELRMMSDVDLIIDMENLEKAIALAEGAGYEIELMPPAEFNAEKDGMKTEFHTDFFTEYMYNRKERFYEALHGAFGYAVPSGDDALTYYLTDTYFYLFSVLHIVKHYETAGCGIRRILDLHILKNALADKIDKTVYNAVMEKGGFSENADKLFALAGTWFEQTPADEDLSDVIRNIITGGNHGSAEQFAHNNYEKDKRAGVRFPKLKRVWRYLFPDREYICIEYPELAERGYSAARCRLYRIADKLKKFRLSHALAHIKSILKIK